MIAIIGAGPVGCYLASLLAPEFEVVVFEKHKGVGLPVQCTGIVTQELFKFVPEKNDFVINKSDNVRIFAPNSKFINLRLKKPDLIIDRQKFDNYLYKQARKKGVKFIFNHKFVSAGLCDLVVQDLKSRKTRKFKYSHLIGADGPLSFVSRNKGLYGNRKFFIGVQAIIKKKNNNIIDFYPFSKGFGWAVPEDKNTLRVGVASRINPKEQFRKLLKKYKGKIISKQGGLIPVFDRTSKFSRENVFLAGDAAGFVKATTGGGLIPGLKSAEILAHSIKNNLSYDAGIYLHLLPKLWLNLKMRKVMDSFTEKEWNNIIKDLNTQKAKQTLQNVNRDHLFQLLLSTAISSPKMVKYGLKHIKSLF